MGRPDEMVKEAQQMIDLGYRSMKLKVGDDLSRDLERMKTVREAVGDDVTIGVDAESIMVKIRNNQGC